MYKCPTCDGVGYVLTADVSSAPRDIISDPVTLVKVTCEDCEGTGALYGKEK